MIRLPAMENTSKLSDTDLCVMCGMCLPQCPTYQLYQRETESPRGRIALIQAINQNRIKADSKALLHIDHCLSCLNCETICPSQVPYGKLIDEFRDRYSQQINKPVTSKLILRQASKINGIKNLAGFASKPLLKTFLQAVGRFTSLADNPFTQTPATLNTLYSGDYSDTSARRGKVSLFTGCSGESLDSDAIKSAIFILNQLKFDVLIAPNQPCCGALHQHNGHMHTAQKCLNDTQKQLSSDNNTIILFFSPACGEQLMQTDQLNTQDVRRFIYEELIKQPLKFSALTQPVALHESCSHRNRLKQKNLNHDLLNNIPGLQIIESTNPSLCCGAAGIQSINYPQQAQTLVQAKLKSFNLTQTSILISDNIGCSLHIKSAVSGYNQPIEILHPVSLLARQLITP